MFILFPMRVREPGGRETIPTANSVLIAVNVLVAVLVGYLPASLAVGRGSGVWTVLTYGFIHANPLHLIGNMWVLWLFGNAVNRRLGNGYYLLSYLGTLVAVGLVAWLFAGGLLLGSSGAIFGILLLFLMLLPRATIHIGYLALLPVTLLLGLVQPPRHWVFWFLRWDSFRVHAWVGLVLVPVVEVWGLWSVGWNWTNLGHLLGLLCGVAIVLLLPTEITMKRRPAPGGVL